MTEVPVLDIRSSALLRHCLINDRFHVTDFMGNGEYPHHRSEKEEAEGFVVAVERALAGPGGDRLADDLAEYTRRTYPPDKLAKAATDGSLNRLLAFSALQRAVDEALNRLEERSLARPTAADFVFSDRPWLLDRLTPRDGLLPLGPDDIDEDLLSEGVILSRGEAFYPHPLLAPMRELVVELLRLARKAELSVSIALNPYRVTAVEDVPLQLLEDYWDGIKITPRNLDSLDAHDVGTPTFHGANQEGIERFFFPLLGTWFDWDRRNKHDSTDPVKRLYIREVCPPTDRSGSELVSVRNRELHSERDTAKKRFTHIDGKVCSYVTADYRPSALEPRADPGTPTASRKLWRVDGPLEDDEWATLVGLHFRGNEDVGKHFAEVFPESFPGA